MASIWDIKFKNGDKFKLKIWVSEDKISDALSQRRKVTALYRKAKKTGKSRTTRLGGGVVAEVEYLGEPEE